MNLVVVVVVVITHMVSLYLVVKEITILICTLLVKELELTYFDEAEICSMY